MSLSEDIAYVEISGKILKRGARMQKTVDICLCLKISEKRWAVALRNGEACFNPIEIFIKKAEKSKNNEQGDKYEGIFARMNKCDKRLSMLQQRFGNDLEIIADREHVLLRRKSSRRIPIFCMYGIKNEELSLVEESIKQKPGKITGEARYEVPDKMYEGFLDTKNVYGYYASSGHFMGAIEDGLRSQGLAYCKSLINYDIDLNSEFYIEPTGSYAELGHKRADLSYQHEIRYWLPFYPRDEKYLLPYKPLSEHSCDVVPGAMCLKMNCVLDRLPE